MSKDLNQQFQRANASGFDDNAQHKLIIAGCGAVALAFILGIIGLTIFFVKAADKFIDAPSTTSSYLSGQSSSGSIYSSSNFVFGEVDKEAQTYTSSFSGVSFCPTTTWTMSSATTTVSTAATIKDFSATGPSSLGTPMVTIVFENMTMRGYSSASDSLATTKTLVAGNDGLLMVDESAVAKWGGHKFTGVIYKHTKYSSYTEVLVAEVDGYIMKISITADSDENLGVVRSYFS